MRVVRLGKDLTMVAISGMVPEALAAAEQLSAGGIDVEVIGPRTLIRKTEWLIVTHDGYKTGGVAHQR